MGDTPLHVAASHGHLEVVNLLLEHDVDTTLRNEDGFIAEELTSDVSVKNAIQSHQGGYDGRYEYGDDDYNDDSD